MRNTTTALALVFASVLVSIGTVPANASPSDPRSAGTPAVAQAASSPAAGSVFGYSIIVHPGIAVRSLTVEQIAGLFTGAIGNWKQVGGPDLKPVVVARSEDSPAQATFERVFLNGAPLSAPGTGEASGSVAAAAVGRTAGAISFVADDDLKASNVARIAVSDFNPLDPSLLGIIGSVQTGRYRPDEVAAKTASAIAPTQSSLDAFQSQSVITRDYIEQSASPIAEFTRIATIAPGVSSTGSANGPGLAESKLIIRGFTDGQYDIDFDGIPFQDTNDPTHHSTAYFPGLIVGGAEVLRGPGSASNLGYGTFGAALNLYSRAPSATPYLELFGADGTWNTTLYGLDWQSGRLPQFGNATFQATFQSLASNGAISGDKVVSRNASFKFEKPLGSTFATFFSTWNRIYYALPDAGNGVTPAELTTLGPYYSLNNDPTSSQCACWNNTTKNTDFEYLRFRSDFGRGLFNDQKFYTYSYDNETLASNSVTSPTSANGTFTCEAGSVTTSSANCNLIFNKNDVGAYTKRNKYRTFGDVEQLTKAFGDGSSFLRLGLWWEHSDTDRFQFSIDANTKQPNYVNGNGVWQGACIANPAFTGMTLPTATATPAPINCSSNSYKGPDAGLAPNGLPYASIKFYQQSQLLTFEPYLEAQIALGTGTTLYPGVKYVNITRYDLAPVENTSRDPNQTNRITYTRTLPYFALNQRISPTFAAYAQYGRGYSVPPLSTFYVYNPAQDSTQPQESGNYQVGFVNKTNRFTWDVDYYWTNFTNKLVSVTAPGQNAANSYYVNIGGARYQGFEFQGTVALGDGYAIYANASTTSAKDLSTGAQIAGVPNLTAAVGFLYKSRVFDGTLTYKLQGQSYATDYSVDLSNQANTPAGIAAARSVYNYYTVPQYGVLDAAFVYRIDRSNRLQINLYNFLYNGGFTTGGYTGIIGWGSTSSKAPGSASDLMIFNPGASLLVTFKHRM